MLSALITFLGDDWRYLYEIEKGSSIFSYLWHPFLTAFAWRSVSDLSWILNYLICGSWTPGYHAVNVLLFVLIIYLFYKITYIISTPRIAVISAIIFSFFPIHYESIIWISGRTDLLAVCLTLFTILAFIQYRAKKTSYWLAGVIIFYGLSLLAKEATIFLPALILSGDLLFTNRIIEKKNKYLPYIYFIFTASLFIIARYLLLGDVVSTSSLFNDRLYSVWSLRAWHSVANISTLLLNFSELKSIWPALANFWGMHHLKIIIFMLLFLTAMNYRQYKNNKFRKLIFLSIVSIIIFIGPVFFLLSDITVNLMHVRFLFAPSLGVAFLLGVLLGFEKQSQLIKLILTIFLSLILCFFIFGGIINYIPWFQANTLTNNILDNLKDQYPEIINSSTSTMVYALSIPGEINGAYVFHDFYSLQQAVKMKYHNQFLTVQIAGTKAVDPHPYCVKEAISTEFIEWENNKFKIIKKYKDKWENFNIKSEKLVINNYQSLIATGAYAYDLQIENDNGKIKLLNFGKNPQIIIPLADKVKINNWKNLNINMFYNFSSNELPQITFAWRPNGSDAFPSFYRIALPKQENISIALCAYPNWLTSTAIGEISLNFIGHYEGFAIINNLELE
ncbi:MAG: glycosyltransferase family 39 protein [Patescibacteria group bacterium]